MLKSQDVIDQERVTTVLEQR